MRLSKTAWWILGIGFFIIAAAVLLTLFSQQSGDAEQLEESLAVNQVLLTKLTSDQEEMTNQLAQLEDQLDEAQLAFNQGRAKFPEEVMSIEYDEELFLAAHDYNLEVLSLVASEPYNNEVDGITFANTFFEMEVRGTVSNILSLINNIATGGYFTAATIDLVNIEVPEPGQEGLPTAIIKIVVYSYEGE